MQIELGSTYVTADGEWVKIVSKLCSLDNPRPCVGDNGLAFDESGNCGKSNWKLLMKVPDEQVALRKVEQLLKDLIEPGLSNRSVLALQERAKHIIEEGKLERFVQHTYR